MFTRKFFDTTIEYEILEGNNKILLIKPGQDSNYKGYNDKYYNLAEYINQKYGFTVICTSNPYDRKHNPIDDAIIVIKEYVEEKQFDEYEVYYFGNSIGGTIGARYAYQYPVIKKLLLINAPLMVNYDRIKDGISKFQGDKLVLVYGSLDPSMNTVRLFDDNNYLGEKVAYYIIEGEDHNFSQKICSYEELCDKYLFTE